MRGMEMEEEKGLSHKISGQRLSKERAGTKIDNS